MTFSAMEGESEKELVMTDAMKSDLSARDRLGLAL